MPAGETESHQEVGKIGEAPLRDVEMPLAVLA
jgi:hypothetical protein